MTNNLFEPLNFDGSVFEPMANFDGSFPESIIYQGEEYSNFIPFKVISAPRPATSRPTASRPTVSRPTVSRPATTRFEPSTTIDGFVVPTRTQSVISTTSGKPMIVTPLNKSFEPISTNFDFPVKLDTLAVSQPLGTRVPSTTTVAKAVYGTVGEPINTPSTLQPSTISSVTESVVTDNFNNPYLLSPLTDSKQKKYGTTTTTTQPLSDINKIDVFTDPSNTTGAFAPDLARWVNDGDSFLRRPTTPLTVNVVPNTLPVTLPVTDSSGNSLAIASPLAQGSVSGGGSGSMPEQAVEESQEEDVQEDGEEPLEEDVNKQALPNTTETPKKSSHGVAIVLVGLVGLGAYLYFKKTK